MAFYRAAIGGGNTTWQHVATVYNTTDTGTSLNITGLTIGKTYHLFATNAGSSLNNARNNSVLTAGTGVDDFSDMGVVNGGTGGSSNTYCSAIRHYVFKTTAASITLGKVSARLIGYMLYEETSNGGGSSIDISDIINVENQMFINSSVKPPVYTVGISVIKLYNPSTGYVLRVYSDAAGTNLIATIGHSATDTVDVSRYNVVYLASGTSITTKITVIS